MQSYTTYSLGEAGYDFTPPHSKNLSALGASSQHPHVFICLPPRLCFPDCLLCLQRGGSSRVLGTKIPPLVTPYPGARPTQEQSPQGLGWLCGRETVNTAWD